MKKKKKKTSQLKKLKLLKRSAMKSTKEVVPAKRKLSFDWLQKYERAIDDSDRNSMAKVKKRVHSKA